MSYSCVVLPTFAIQLKRLAKKYRQIGTDLRELQKELVHNPKAGIALKHNCYKIRVANSSVPTGKSGGFRVVYYFVDTKNRIFLMSIYTKTQRDSISDNELLELIKANGLEK